MVSTSGSRLLPLDAIEHVRTNLLPMTTILTPNIPEAKLLLENAGVAASEPQNVDDMVSLARQVKGLGSKAVLLKGGHLPFTSERIRASPSGDDASIVIDILVYSADNKEEEDEVVLTETEFLTSKNTHGTGCSLASAIAANLARGSDLKTSVRAAIKYVEAGIKYSVDMGQGSGPINHFHSLYNMPFAPYVFPIKLCLS
jgi:hydroxymethylpyrimidine/phosphomethylpyrimidine kinase / thiaminase